MVIELPRALKLYFLRAFAEMLLKTKPHSLAGCGEAKRVWIDELRGSCLVLPFLEQLEGVGAVVVNVFKTCLLLVNAV